MRSLNANPYFALALIETKNWSLKIKCPSLCKSKESGYGRPNQVFHYRIFSIAISKR